MSDGFTSRRSDFLGDGIVKSPRNKYIGHQPGSVKCRVRAGNSQWKVCADPRETRAESSGISSLSGLSLDSLSPSIIKWQMVMKLSHSIVIRLQQERSGGIPDTNTPFNYLSIP